MFSLTKIKIQQIISSKFNLVMNEEELIKHKISQQDTPLFRQLALIREEDTDHIDELIFVEAKHNKKRKPYLTALLYEGFTFNGKLYKRFGKSSSQAKDGITIFIREDFYEEMMRRSQLDVQIDKCVVSKYESYRNLILSSCMMVEEDLPNIVIIDEYEKTLHDQYVRYVDENIVEYQSPSGEIKKGTRREIKEGITDVKLSPFDGFGVHNKATSKTFKKYLPKNNKSILFQIRLPFMKGVSVEVDFTSYFKENGVTEIKDVFGKVHNVENIDCIWNVSMWKGYGYFKKAFGDEAWDKYLEKVRKYDYKIGISKYNHSIREIDIFSRMNFQYLQCLNLSNPRYIEQFKNKDFTYDVLDPSNEGKIGQLAKYTTDLFEKIISGDKFYTLKFLGINDTDDSSNPSLESKYIKAILTNDSMLKDPSIKKMIKRKLDKAIQQAKYGKIYVEGFYHTVVGDIIGYLEYAGGNFNPVGCLKEGEFYADTIGFGDCVSMRSPLVDPSEVNKVKLTRNKQTNKYLSHFKNKDIVMINMYDLSMQIQGGMDMDGDSVFLTNNPIILESKIDLPTVVDIADKQTSNPVEYNMHSINVYELNSRDSRIGEITNIATSILSQYTEDEKWLKINKDNVAMLRLYQGKEIDYLKTGFRWIISKNLRKYLKQLPFFLLYNYPKKLKVYNNIREINKDNEAENRIPYNAFRSPSPMNELADYINAWEKKVMGWDKTLLKNDDILIDPTVQLTNKNTMREIKRIYNQFDEEIREYIDEGKKIDSLVKVYEGKLYELEINRKLLSNYCIKTAYKSLSTSKTLCWLLFGEDMINNLQTNTDKREACVIRFTNKDDEAAKEFLGKYYKLEKKFKEDTVC